MVFAGEKPWTTTSKQPFVLYATSQVLGVEFHLLLMRARAVARASHL